MGNTRDLNARLTANSSEVEEVLATPAIAPLLMDDISTSTMKMPSNLKSSKIGAIVLDNPQASQVEADLYLDEKLFLEGLSLGVSLDQTDQRGTFFNISLSENMSEIDINLGKLHFHKFIAGCRQKVWWMVPAWGTSVSDIPPETQFLLMQLTENGTPTAQEMYAVILPLVSGPYRSALRPGNNGSILLRVETGDSQTSQSDIENIVFVAAGTNPYKLLSEAFTAASERVKTFRPREGKILPKYFDVFG